MVVVSHLFPFYGKILPNYSHFNPRLREGGDSFSFDTSLQIYNFNPRLREGGDVRFCEPYLTSSIFQSTPPRRRRRNQKQALNYPLGFQSTPPRRRRQLGTGVYYKGGRFQSTPPRRRRRQHIVIPQLSCTYLVSTTFLSAIFSFISQYVVLFFFF